MKNLQMGWQNVTNISTLLMPTQLSDTAISACFTILQSLLETRYIYISILMSTAVALILST